jgi:hypothetical protein
MDKLYIKAGKGRKDRCTVLSEKAAVSLKEFCKSHGIQTWLFPGQPSSRHLSIRSAQRVFEKAARNAGIIKKTSIHVRPPGLLKQARSSEKQRLLAGLGRAEFVHLHGYAVRKAGLPHLCHPPFGERHGHTLHPDPSRSHFGKDNRTVRTGSPQKCPVCKKLP